MAILVPNGEIPIQMASATVDAHSGELGGLGGVLTSVKRLGDLAGVFADEAARAALPQDTPIYRVQTHVAEREGTPGGLFFGTSFLYPGVVGQEYFMTRGHFHANSGTAEYYWCISGEGVLLKMTRDRVCTAERMTPGSLHYIPGHVAHRLVNVGSGMLVVGACWPSDAGHDYETIARQGFSARVLCRDGAPIVIAQGGV